MRELSRISHYLITILFSMESVHCYNKGCGKKFDPTKNEKDCCQFHPGAPVFHDAMKGWSCCKKRSTDFTEFLNFPGCTTGCHSNEKPKEEPKPTPAVDVPDCQEVKVEPPKQRAPLEIVERPSLDEPMKRLKVTVVPSLEKALEKHLQKISLEDNTTDTSATGTVTVGTTCKNSGCKTTYESESTDLQSCQYHSGVAIFHEGMKFWSCCQRKTSDFTNFLDQEGCTKGKHTWIKKEPDTKQSCRLDWFQTSPAVTLSVFSKLPVPDRSYVEVNQVSCNIHIVFDGGRCLYDHSLVFRNPINPETSEVKMMGTKVEIILRKAEAFSWPSLELPPAVSNSKDKPGDHSDEIDEFE